MTGKHHELATRLASSLGWNDSTTTGSISHVDTEAGCYILIDDGDAYRYACDASDVLGWLDVREGAPADYTEDFCQWVDLVSGEELQALVDTLGHPLGGVCGDAYSLCSPSEYIED
jgi:hypothetical protein